MTDNYSHIAFADESHYNLGQYRALGVVTLSRESESEVCKELQSILYHYSKAELKWNKVNGDTRTQGAAEEVCEFVISSAAKNKLRVDVLVWDIQDSRHNVQGRDDIENLHRMYHHLFVNVLAKRWPDQALWLLNLDENTALNFDQIGYFLELLDSNFEVREPNLLDQKSSIFWRTYYKVVEIKSCVSHDFPLLQVADLLAGMACFSRKEYPNYCQWDAQNPRLTRLPLYDDITDTLSPSRSQKARFQLLRQFNDNCKEKKLGVSLNSHKGLRTMNPNRGINFWWYQPQSEFDKAPTRFTP